MFFFFVTRISSPGKVLKRTLDDPDNVLQTVCFQIENQEFHKIIPEEEICFDCLVQKAKHTNHCDSCDVCLPGFQLHSKFFNLCVADKNL